MASSKPNSVPRPAHTHIAPPTVSGRWLLAAVAVTIPAAGFCAWAVLCLLFWQGSWQLLYHPTSAVARTPAAASLAFDSVAFATTESGATQLTGWWIPATPSAQYTILYLHGADGNLGDTIDDLARLHSAGVNLLAFDYRGYGQSRFVHPNESTWRQDAEWALQYLAATRHIDPHTIVLVGTGLGANLALEFAAAHSELAGVVLENPIDSPVNTIFNDPRARLVPARLLFSDRYDTAASAAALRIPSLWFFQNSPSGQSGSPESSSAFQKVTAARTRVWLTPAQNANQTFTTEFSRWLVALNK
jgi:hypothetical protein